MLQGGQHGQLPPPEQQQQAAMAVPSVGDHTRRCHPHCDQARGWGGAQRVCAGGLAGWQHRAKRPSRNAGSAAQAVARRRLPRSKPPERAIARCFAKGNGAAAQRAATYSLSADAAVQHSAATSSASAARRAGDDMVASRGVEREIVQRASSGSEAGTSRGRGSALLQSCRALSAHSSLPPGCSHGRHVVERAGRHPGGRHRGLPRSCGGFRRRLAAAGAAGGCCMCQQGMPDRGSCPAASGLWRPPADGRGPARSCCCRWLPGLVLGWPPPTSRRRRCWCPAPAVVATVFAHPRPVSALQVHANSPGEKAGLEAYFDYILCVNDVRLVRLQGQIGQQQAGGLALPACAASRRHSPPHPALSPSSFPGCRTKTMTISSK